MSARRLPIGAMAALLAASLPAGATAATIAGLWLTEDRDGVIRIAPCGGRLCGFIVGIGTFAPDGSPPKDIKGRSQCQLEIIHALVEGEPGQWSGTITDPEDGRAYKTRLWLDDAGRLRLRGYIGIPLFGSTQTWTSYSGRLAADCRMTH